MNTYNLKAEVRDGIGKRSSLQALRKQGLIPANLYGSQGGNTNIQVPEYDLNKLVFTSEVAFINIELGGEGHKCVLKDLQFHPVTDKVIHADFMKVEENRPVVMNIPVKTVGTSLGVLNGGKKQEKLRKITVKALPGDMPSHIEVDITKLRIGQSIKVQDLNMDKLEFLNAGNAVVVEVKTSRGVQADAEEENLAEAPGDAAPAENAEA